MPPLSEEAAESLLRSVLAPDETVAACFVANEFAMPRGPIRPLVAIGIPGFAVLAAVLEMPWLGALSVVMIVVALGSAIVGSPRVVGVTDTRLLIVSVLKGPTTGAVKAFAFTDLRSVSNADAKVGPSTLHVVPRDGEPYMLTWRRTEAWRDAAEKALRLVNQRLAR